MAAAVAWFVRSRTSPTRAAIAEGPPLVERLRVRPEIEIERDNAPVLAYTLELPGELEKAQFDGAKSVARIERPPALGEGRERLQVEVESMLTLTIPGPFKAAGSQRVIVDVASTSRAYVRAVFHGSGRPFAGSPTRPTIRETGSDPRFETITVDVPGTLRSKLEFESMLLEFQMVQPGTLLIDSVQVLGVPLAAWLPDASEGAELVSVGGDSRRAVALSSKSAQTSLFEVPGGARLAISASFLQELRPTWGVGRLTIELDNDEGESLVEHVDLLDEPNGPAKWRDLQVPLDRFAGTVARARFSLGEVGDDEQMCALTEPVVWVPRPEARSVLLITSDTHRADHLGFSSGRWEVLTPNLDAFAARSLTFSDCLAATNVTNPSHTAMLTGLSPRDHGVVDNVTAAPDSLTTIAEVFRANGYRTLAAASAAHLAAEVSGLGQGFDEFDTPLHPDRPGSATIGHLLSRVDAFEGAPTFVWLHVYDAHTPYEPPGEFERIYWDDSAKAFDPKLPEPRVPDAAYHFMPPDLRDLDYWRARYRGEVSALDDMLASVLQHPRLSKDVIAFTADHGESLGEHDVFWDHARLLPQTMRVPLILSWPGGPQGVQSSAPVCNADIGRTLINLAGLNDVEFVGADLVERVERPRALAPRFSLSAHSLSAAIVHDGWLLELALKPTWTWIDRGCHEPSPEHSYELFDLRNDPECSNDVARSEPQRAAAMRKALIEWLTAAKPIEASHRRSSDASLIQGLAKLGYAGDVDEDGGVLFDPACECRFCVPSSN